MSFVFSTWGSPVTWRLVAGAMSATSSVMRAWECGRHFWTVAEVVVEGNACSAQAWFGDIYWPRLLGLTLSIRRLRSGYMFDGTTSKSLFLSTDDVGFNGVLCRKLLVEKAVYDCTVAIRLLLGNWSMLVKAAALVYDWALCEAAKSIKTLLVCFERNIAPF